MIAIIDYGVGNLFSLTSSVAHIGERAEVTSDPETIKKADRIILPGVGAFSDAKAKLCEKGLDKLIVSEAESGKPLLGICLGMQMLFTRSFEYGEYDGLSLIEGDVVPIKQAICENVKIPHMGWNSLEFNGKSPLFKYVSEGEYVYYVHSYYAKTPIENVIASSAYGGARLTGAVCKNNVYGTQFHPEKSGETGLSILRAFAEI